MMDVHTPLPENLFPRTFEVVPSGKNSKTSKVYLIQSEAWKHEGKMKMPGIISFENHYDSIGDLVWEISDRFSDRRSHLTKSPEGELWLYDADREIFMSMETFREIPLQSAIHGYAIQSTACFGEHLATLYVSQLWGVRREFYSIYFEKIERDGKRRNTEGNFYLDVPISEVTKDPSLTPLSEDCLIIVPQKKEIRKIYVD